MHCTCVHILVDFFEGVFQHALHVRITMLFSLKDATRLQRLRASCCCTSGTPYYRSFSPDVIPASLVHRTKKKKVFWEFHSIMHNTSHNLILFCATTSPSYHMIKNHLLYCDTNWKTPGTSCSIEKGREERRIHVENMSNISKWPRQLNDSKLFH